MTWLVTVFNVAIGLVIAVAFFLGYSDHSWSAAVQWAVFYAVGVGIPAVWSRRTARALNDLGVPLSRELRLAPLYPILVGMMTTVMAVALIREAVLSR